MCLSPNVGIGQNGPHFSLEFIQIGYFGHSDWPSIYSFCLYLKLYLSEMHFLMASRALFEASVPNSASLLITRIAESAIMSSVVLSAGNSMPLPEYSLLPLTRLSCTLLWASQKNTSCLPVVVICTCENTATRLHMLHVGHSTHSRNIV